MTEDIASIIRLSFWEAFPELRDGYTTMAKEAHSGFESWSAQDIEDMRLIAQVNNLPPRNYSLPGYTLVLEDLLVPLIIELSRSRQKSNRIVEVMHWVEEMASSPVFKASNSIATSVCEPLITNYSEYLPGIVPHMGMATKKLCVMLFPMFRIDDATKRLFGYV